MNKAYHETLSRDYFDNLYARVAHKLIRGENVCLSVIPGFGTKTVFNFLHCLFGVDGNFNAIKIFDPEIESLHLIDFSKKLIHDEGSDNKLIIVRFFERINDKKNVLEALDSIRRPNPKKLVFLVITDHTGITFPQDYFGITTTFFSEIIYLKPFNFKNTSKMIDTLNNFFGWKIDKAKYKYIYKLSGGIPRLIKYICKGIAESYIPIVNSEKFQKIPHIAFQMDLLIKLLIKLPKDQLDNLGVTKAGKIKSTLLEKYFKNFKSEIVQTLYPHLSSQESKVLSYILENEGQIISLEKIGDIMEMNDEDYSLWAIYKLISRLKPKVRNNFEIKNSKGNGYYLNKIG